MNLEWKFCSWSDWPKDDMYECLKLRINVFVVEQDCPYPELDDKDKQSWHLYGIHEDRVVAYTRIVLPGVSYNDISIGRVVVDPTTRGAGLGHILMNKTIEVMEQKWGHQPIRISAQQYLIKYYADHGFEQVSDSYLEDGIPHVEMLRS